MVQNKEYEKELKQWERGNMLSHNVGIVGWFDEHKKVSIHDAVLRYDSLPKVKEVQSQEEQRI